MATRCQAGTSACAALMKQPVSGSVIPSRAWVPRQAACKRTPPEGVYVCVCIFRYQQQREPWGWSAVARQGPESQSRHGGRSATRCDDPRRVWHSLATIRCGLGWIRLGWGGGAVWSPWALLCVCGSVQPHDVGAGAAFLLTSTLSLSARRYIIACSTVVFPCPWHTTHLHPTSVHPHCDLSSDTELPHTQTHKHT